MQIILVRASCHLKINPCNAEATFIQSTMTQKKKLKIFKPCCVSIHWISLTEYCEMNTCTRVLIVFMFLHHFVLAKLATSSIRVKGLSAQVQVVTVVVGDHEALSPLFGIS